VVPFEHLLGRCVVELEVREVLRRGFSAVRVLGQYSQVSGSAQILGLNVAEVREVLLVNHVVRVKVAYFELGK